MLRRKMESTMLEWKNTKDKKPLVIKGIRQCGKTFIVKKFARQNYRSVVYMNFILEPDKATAFSGNKDIDTIILNLSSMIPGSKFIPGQTCIILDEIQECPEARTALKSFKEDGRFDVIATGSLLGVKGYGEKRREDKKAGTNSIPVGHETIVEMYPLDFEEFLWANGINEKVLESVAQSLRNEVPVLDGIHSAMTTLLYRYVIVGGLPAAVNKFLETKDIGQVYKVQREILDEYEDDMVKYAVATTSPRQNCRSPGTPLKTASRSMCRTSVCSSPCSISARRQTSCKGISEDTRGRFLKI